MWVKSSPQLPECRGCHHTGTLYTDKYGHRWCCDCERWNGIDPCYAGSAHPERIPSYPGEMDMQLSLW